MKYFSSAVFFATILLCVFSVLPISGYAQLGDPGEDPDALIPVDGGVVLLIAAGVGYGAKKVKEQRKRKTAVVENKENKY